MKLLPMVVLLMATSAFGEIYTWTDARGAAHYTNRPDEIPARHRARAKALNYGAEPEAGAASPQQVQSPKPFERRAAEGTVVSPAQQGVTAPQAESNSKDMHPMRLEQRDRMKQINRMNRSQK